jgi:hypothetical protein
MKQKLESIINEQSIIQEVQSDEPQVDSKQSNDYRLKIVYFLRDLSQVCRFKIKKIIKKIELIKINFFKVSLHLKDLNTIDTRQVHDNCIEDLNVLRQAIKSNSKN